MNCEADISLPWSPYVTPSGIYRRLFFARRSDLKTNAMLPRLTCEASDVRVRQAHVDQYRSVTVHPSRDPSVPLFYPHALFGSAHLQMFAHPSFPFRATGLLHLRNHVIRYRPLDLGRTWNMHCQLTRQRNVEKGLEFDFDSVVQVAGETVWSSISTYLKRGKGDGSEETSELADLFPSLEMDADAMGGFDVPHNIGKRYARVTGDYNPIHVSRIAAKLFGFKRAIAHGMWSIARAIHELPAIENPVRHDVAFKGPMYVHSQATINVGRGSDRFDVFCGDNPRPVIVGLCRKASDSEQIIRENEQI